jgi:uncharacterized membrane protein
MMNAFARKWAGGAIMGISFFVGIYLYFSGVPLMTLVERQTKTYPNGGMMVVANYKAHWPLIALFVTGALGLCLLLIPSTKRIPPIIRSESKV